MLLFFAYYRGGYVAGRLASPMWKQGLAVWLRAVAVAVVVGVAAAVAGSKFDVLSRLNSFPRISVDGVTVTTAGLLTLLVASVTSLIGAPLGGRRNAYHRKIDRAGLGA